MTRMPEGTTSTGDLRLDPQMAAALKKKEEIAAQLGAGPVNPSPEESRARVLAEKRFWNEDPIFLPQVEDVSIPGPHRDVRVRVYRPDTGNVLPAVVYIHGGGWVRCNIETHDRLCRILARESGATVLSVDYAMAPEHKFPIPLDECVAAVLAIRDRAAELRIDPARMALSGDSAGGNLALAAALDLRTTEPGLVKALVLYYGVFGTDLDTESYTVLGDGRFGLSRADMDAYWAAYLRSDRDRDDPRAAPLKADLSGLPPAFLAAAELDVLRDDTLRLAARMRELGLPHELKRYPGVCHGFLDQSRMVDAGVAALADGAGFLRAVF